MSDVVKLLLSIAGGTDAQLRGHDIILYAATDEIDRLRSERDGLAEKAKLHDYMQEVAKANGYDCLTDAITKANAYGKERDTLVEQLAKAVEGLRPFAKAAVSYIGMADNDEVNTVTEEDGDVLKVGHLRQAARILSSLEKP